MKMLLPLLRLISRLPLGVLYVLADLCFPLLYYVARYRRKVVTENLNNAFPELTPRERRKIRRRFYRWFCDYVVETLKLLSMSRQEMMRRMVIEGVDEMERSLETKPFVFIFLGHYCNWEWVSSIPLWYQKEDSHGAQLYRPLKNKAFDGLFLEMRSRFGSENISKYEALRHILQLRRDGKKTCIGFISDQTPGWNSIHDWVDFLHQDTPVFTGTERIAKKVDAAIFFADIRRVRRGYYHLVLRRMTDEPKDFPD
ncbi:MAG: lysophospholipid acyltransferase family protein, partial [Prevotellamassilia sp.]|nr:lysophospholipid acyltransferase family protein [Prevotellamassilia sp.]